MAGRSALRASDADRERVAERLRKAAGEGRLLTEELEQRLEASFAARTYGQLDAVLSDLPGRRLPAPARTRRDGWLRPTLALAIAVPLALAVIAAVALVVTGVLAGWVLWVLAGWFLFGRHRRRMYRSGGYGRSRHACATWQRGRREHWA
jgi:DUF1707 SHOCT-like domain